MERLDDDRVWLTRLRWRLRGAWQWPLMWLLTVVEAVLINRLPLADDDGPGLVAAFLLCGIVNLFVVALLGPVLARIVRRARPHLPLEIATDRAASVLLVAGFGLVLGLGIAHRPAVRAMHEDADRQLAAARAWFADHAPPAVQDRIGHEDVEPEGDNLYRTCLPSHVDARRAFCAFVDTSVDPPKVTEDPDERANGVIHIDG